MGTRAVGTRAVSAANTSSRFELTGGALCLDFANTVSRRPTPAPRDHLADYTGLLAWASAARAITRREERRLRDLARRHPRAARKVFVQAVTLREAIFALFSALARHRNPSPDAFPAVETVFGAQRRSWSLKSATAGPTWTWNRAHLGLELPLWASARSAIELVLSPGVRDLRECAARDCAWLFLDASRTRRRRWCDMRVCGNREKFRRFSARRRAR
jgi:predicted RNA-binding Zn ribbon-like protein